MATGYTLADEGQACTAACDAKELTCDTVMTANNNHAFKRLGLDFSCSSFVSDNPEDPAQPYILISTRVCYGFFGRKSTSCEVSKPGARRLCRCERPGE